MKKYCFQYERDNEIEVFIGVGYTVHFLGDGLRSMWLPFFSQDISLTKLNPKFYWILCIFGGLPPKKPAATAEIHILKGFVKQIKNYSRYWNDICTDCQWGTQN